jgi:hypothetical protein
LKGEDPYVALTSYTLRDGTNFQGYCFIYDCSGHVLFGANGEPVPLSTYAYCSPQEASALARALGRRVENIFPIQFRASVTVHGMVQEGELNVQSNNALERTREE